MSPTTSSLARLGLLGTLETRQNMFFHRAEAPRDSINGALLTHQPVSQATTFIHKLHQMILPNLEIYLLIYIFPFSLHCVQNCAYLKYRLPTFALEQGAACNLTLGTWKKVGWTNYWDFAKSKKFGCLCSCIKEQSVLSIVRQTRNYLSWSVRRSV